MCVNFGREPRGKGLAKPHPGETQFDKIMRLVRRRLCKEKRGKYGPHKKSGTEASPPMSETQRLAMLAASD